jgi:hypothetical protein
VNGFDNATYIERPVDVFEVLTEAALLESVRRVQGMIPAGPLTIQVSGEYARLIVEHDLFPDTIGPLVRKAVAENS